MANKQHNDGSPIDGTLAAFLKEADKDVVEPYRLDVGKGKRVTFKSPDEIGTAEFVKVFGGELKEMSDADGIAYFLNTCLSEEDRKAYLAANPPIRVTLLVMDAVHKHYEAQVPSEGESDASSD